MIPRRRRLLMQQPGVLKLISVPVLYNLIGKICLFIIFKYNPIIDNADAFFVNIQKSHRHTNKLRIGTKTTKNYSILKGNSNIFSLKDRRREKVENLKLNSGYRIKTKLSVSSDHNNGENDDSFDEESTIPATTSPGKSKQRLYLHLKYDGTNFEGWLPTSVKTKGNEMEHLKLFKAKVLENQKIRTKKELKQLKSNAKNGRKKVSIFEKLTNALVQLHEKGSLLDVDVFRNTEIGVHAEFQICYFDTLQCPFRGDVEKLTFALNRILPPEIYISSISPLPYFMNSNVINKHNEYHHNLQTSIDKDSLQFDYCYTINYSSVQDPMTRLYEWNKAWKRQQTSEENNDHKRPLQTPLNITYLENLVEEEILHRDIALAIDDNKETAPSAGRIHKFAILDKKNTGGFQIEDSSSSSFHDFEPWSGPKISLLFRTNSALSELFLCQLIGLMIELGELHMEIDTKVDNSAEKEKKEVLHSVLTETVLCKDSKKLSSCSTFSPAPVKGLMLTNIMLKT